MFDQSIGRKKRKKISKRETRERYILSGWKDLSRWEINDFERRFNCIESANRVNSKSLPLMALTREGDSSR